jgi:DNA-directed RNA polymerase subunit M/transcription elongation factor TFIIS
MVRTKKGFVCSRCGIVRYANPDSRALIRKNRESSVYVLGESTTEHSKIDRRCPKCGNKEAFYWFSGVSGEHAGIRQERTIEHFKCTKCGFSWAGES